MNEIMEYIKQYRKGRWNRIGVIIGTLDSDGKIRVGWSKCNLKAGDGFNKKYGIEVAYNRAIGKDKTPPVPRGNIHQIRSFYGRCLMYFCDAKEIILAKQE